MMGQRGEWIPPSAPLSEGYWQALLRDGEHGRAAPTASQAVLWDERVSGSVETPQRSVETIAVGNPWAEAQELMSCGEVLELPVVGCNRGGLLVGWNGLQGFVPASHLLTLTPSADEEARQEELRHFIGTKLPLRIIEVDSDSDRFVLSERATQVDIGHRNDVLSNLKCGDVCEGRVTNLCSFGAFVDLGGFEGLVHISELSWGRVGHPSDVLKPGQTVTVYVLNVEPERERVGLSIKRLQPNPWQSVEDDYQVGQIVEGTVTHVVDFGAFVQVEEGLEGLIHVSELASGNPCDPRQILHEGDGVTVEVLNVDGARRRMGLRLERIRAGEGSRRTGEPPEEAPVPEGQ
ncbi:MAG: S1 RNA-binding domain-containing protein [Anaerolineae bacterium]|jgi:small subunit ribosomal protein S1